MNDTDAFDLNAYTQDRISLVNAALDRFTPPADTEPASLHTAMRYSLQAGGKRIRPLLCIAGAEAVGGSAESVLPMACALEMLHTFSLIHDDLPAMDNDDFRRGVPTSHKQFGEAIAILAGDALQTLAFETIATHQTAENPVRILRAIRIFAEASGSLGMGGGQVDDIAHEGKPITLEILRHIHERKTGALLNASLLCGAILSNATGEQEAALRTYSSHIGVAFQIVDDILDVTGDDVKLGKQTGSDVRKDKATYPKLVGLEASARLACEASEAAIAALSAFDDRAEPLRAFARFIVERDM